jgi:hypothetical protein
MPQYAAMIAALLLDRPTCLNCATSMAPLSETEALRYLEIIAITLVVLHLENEHCRVCGTVGPVFCVRRPANLRCPGDHRHDRMDGDLHAKARLLAQTREIPSIRVTDNTDGKPCSLLCGRQIARGELWYELRASSSTSVLLDHACFEIWKQEIERAKDHT